MQSFKNWQLSARLQAATRDSGLHEPDSASGVLLETRTNVQLWRFCLACPKPTLRYRSMPTSRNGHIRGVNGTDGKRFAHA